jgi:hypothetical protein
MRLHASYHWCDSSSGSEGSNSPNSGRHSSSSLMNKQQTWRHKAILRLMNAFCVQL